MENKGLSELDLRLLHDFYHELGIKYPDVLTSYTVFLRNLRAQLHPMGTPDYRKARLDNGLVFEVDVGDRLGCDFYYGIYSEYIDSTIFRRMVSPDSVLFDIGTNFGYYAISSASIPDFKGIVHAFEPNDAAFELLERNILANGLAERIVAHRCAMGSQIGSVPFYLAAESSFSGLYDTRRSNIRGLSTVPISTIDDFVEKQNLEKLDLIKVDVEGLECEVLQGAATTIRKNLNIFIQIEVAPKNLDQSRLRALAAELKVLYEFGFIGSYVDTQEWRLVRLDDVDDLLSLKSGINLFLVKGGSDAADRLQAIAAELLRKEVKMAFHSRQLTFSQLTLEPGAFSQIFISREMQHMRDVMVSLNASAAYWREQANKNIFSIMMTRLRRFLRGGNDKSV
jgi:FkbM family methyltransferase